MSLGTNTGVSVSGSKGSGSGNGSDTTFVNSTVSAGNTATIKSGGDTNLNGAVVSGNQVRADVGGNLNIASQQDASSYTSQQSSSGGSLTFGTGGVTGGGLSSSKSNIDSNFASVGQQSGIRAGDGGFQVNVQGNTDLKGGVISSTQAAVDQGKNSFSTGSITMSDVQNNASYEGKASGLSIDVGKQAGKFDVSGVGIGLGGEKGSASSTTTSGISGIAGNTAVRTGDAKTGLKPIFDAAKVRASIDAQVQIMQAFTKEAPKAVGNFAQGKLNDATALRAQAMAEKDPERISALNAQAQELEDTWSEGKPGRVLLHTLVGALSGGLQGAVGAASSQTAVPLLGAQIAGMDVPPAIKEALIAIAGTAVGAETGGTAGAVSGLTATVNNYLNHTDVEKLASQIKACGDNSSCKDKAIEQAYITSAINDMALLNCKATNNCDTLKAEYRQGYSDIQDLMNAGVKPTDVAAIMSLESNAQSIIRNGLDQRQCLTQACTDKANYLTGIGKGLSKITPVGLVAGTGLATYELTTAIMNNGAVETAVAVASGVADLPANLKAALNSSDAKIRGEALVDALAIGAVATAIVSKLGTTVLESVSIGPAAGGRAAQRGAIGNLKGASAKFDAELTRIAREGHALERHGGGVTDAQLLVRATTGVAPDGSVVIRNGQTVVPPSSTAFNSSSLLTQSDLIIRQNYLDRAIALSSPGVQRITIEGVDMGVTVGRGYDRVSSVPGNAGPLQFNSALSRVTAVYDYDAATKTWRTTTIYPVK
ncbi:hypothetical protein PMI15_02082 [Polaromonas sp. CF318]|nr:hypothetical protein PMI15_02082 [Polaromonas sp. CF318]